MKSLDPELGRRPVAARWTSNIGAIVLLAGVAASFAGADRLWGLCIFAMGAPLMVIGGLLDARRSDGCITMLTGRLFWLLLHFAFACGCFVEIALSLQGMELCSSSEAGSR